MSQSLGQLDILLMVCPDHHQPPNENDLLTLDPLLLSEGRLEEMIPVQIPVGVGGMTPGRPTLKVRQGEVIVDHHDLLVPDREVGLPLRKVLSQGVPPLYEDEKEGDHALGLLDREVRRP